ncbi:unnamed protein product [Hermetia illucens]|uniref:MADF domain-containing protein n=1 Tax=Hermetia illucens TaxID=343691 RepID=A0A7R8YVQ4_HERIL|nr:transcription factor Adf-1-like [Hermetia illucens]CAD7084045.1 unnamed protein product [Hermetia illucens]
MDLRLLIRLVRKNPALWDNHSESYKKLPLKHRIWKKIASKLKCDVDAVKRRWKILRDRYAREHRKLAQIPENSSYEPWELYEEMLFLKDTLKPRIIYETLDNSMQKDAIFIKEEAKSTEDGEGSNESEDISDLDEVQEPPTPPSRAKSRFSKPRSRKDDPSCSYSQELQKTLTTFLEVLKSVLASREHDKTPDETELFSQLVAQRLRIVPESQRRQIEVEILKYINTEIDNMIDINKLGNIVNV